MYHNPHSAFLSPRSPFVTEGKCNYPPLKVVSRQYHTPTGRPYLLSALFVDQRNSCVSDAGELWHSHVIPRRGVPIPTWPFLI